jgi:hypothetical protein
MTFEKYLISSRLRLRSEQPAQNSLRIHILLDSEISTADTDAVSFARKIYGDLRPRILYPGAEGGLEWLIVLPATPSRPLTRSSQQGNSHRATSQGAAVAGVLCQSASFDGKTPVSLVFSSALSDALRGVEAGFLQGLISRSTSNKLPGGTLRKEVSPIEVYLPGQQEAGV